ncbi:hypothetical protein GCM10009805_11230 [Leucobacter chromiireducens subsp. solipictus]
MFFGIAERDYSVGEIVDLSDDLTHVFEVMSPIHEGDEIYFDPCDERHCVDCYSS